MKFKVGETLSEFYEDLKVAYMKARPSAPTLIMKEDIPPEVYAKCVSNFHLKGEI